VNDNDYRDGWTPEVRAHLLDNIESLRREMTSIMSTLPPHVVAAPGWHCAPAPGAPWPCPATPPACASGPTRSRGRPWSTTPTGARLHIAFMHHPPTWLADWKHVEPYLSRAHLLLFGHEHKYKAEQPIDGRTVFVYAGAVGPHEGEGDDYVPSWNLITLKRATSRSSHESGRPKGHASGLTRMARQQRRSGSIYKASSLNRPATRRLR